MSTTPVPRPSGQATPASLALTEPTWLRRLLIGVVLTFLGAFLLLPLAVVFHEAFRQGLRVYLAAITDPVAIAAIELTLIAAGTALVANTLFGVATAWLLTRFRFPGKTLLASLIDLPFAVSPVIAGLIFILVFGAQGWAENRPVAFLWPIIHGTMLVAGIGLGVWAIIALLRRRFRPWVWLGSIILAAAPILLDPLATAWIADGNDLQVIFATPGIILATIFITFPFVARELIPVMQSVGQEEEQAALSLGAGGWSVFWRITLPNVKWGLLYGIILCNARAMGEYGAVSVVSGHIRGRTNTMPLHIEILFNEYQFAAAFAVASILAGLALVTLVVKTIVERRLESSGPQG